MLHIFLIWSEGWEIKTRKFSIPISHVSNTHDLTFGKFKKYEMGDTKNPYTPNATFLDHPFPTTNKIKSENKCKFIFKYIYKGQ